MLPDEIKALRALRGWTQNELSRELGVTLRAVQHWEGGQRKPGGAAVKLLGSLANSVAKKKRKTSDDVA